MILLQRREPARRMARFYRLHSVTADLFGRVTVVREWGRIGSPGRVRVDHYDNPQDAAVWLDWLARVKRRRGYQSSAPPVPPPDRPAAEWRAADTA